MVEPSAPPGSGAARAAPLDLLRVRSSGAEPFRDAVSIEEPLEIRVAGPGSPADRVAVTMRTPGHDDELAVGFLFGEGLIDGRDHLHAAPRVGRRDVPDPDQVVTVELARAFDRALLSRNFYVTSSCGVCGKAALDFVEVAVAPLAAGPLVPVATILGLPDALRAAQPTFHATGGLHATARFDARGELRCVREDVGRHNAMDKVVGRAILDGEVPLTDSVLLVSGRLSFELVQKAALAGVPILCAVSAPTSLAVRLAERVGMTLIGFLRDGRFNVYAHPERIDRG